MHKIGVVLLLVGALATAIGLLFGFGFMFAARDEMAKRFLGVIPVGFLAVFTGMVMTLLSNSGVSDRKR